MLLPLGIMLLTGGLLAYAARDALRPTTPVRVVRVVAKQGGPAPNVDAGAASEVSVQAPGWVEPDPYPTYVTALADGVIANVLVLEGDTVKAGQVVAEMVDDDARLAVARASAHLSRQQAVLAAARTDWQNPVALERAVAVSKARLAEAQAESAQLEATIAQQNAKLKELQSAFDRVSKLSPNAASKLEVEQAQFQLDAQRALVEATKKARPVLDSQVARFQAEAKAAATDLELRVTLRQALDAATAEVAEAQAALDEAELRLTRMKIVSPVAGIVMNRLAVPGAKVMLAMDSPHSAHVAHVYDPKRLQVRVDVPLADAAKVGVGQPARVVVDVLPDMSFVGRVTRFVHQADISKNTVEVKVAIEDPSPLLKPDMLARVKFMAASATGGRSGSTPSSTSTLRVFALRASIVRDGQQSYVWVVAADEPRLRRQAVHVGPSNEEGWVVVIEGLQPGDVLVADPQPHLREGQRVSIRESADPST